MNCPTCEEDIILTSNNEIVDNKSSSRSRSRHYSKSNKSETISLSAEKNYKQPRHWIERPIECGFLNAYSESQFSSENIKYLMAIDSFRDIFDGDKYCWTKSMNEIDAEISLFALKDEDNELKFSDELPTIGGENDWPSNIIKRSAAIKNVVSIWNRFLSQSSPEQICIPYAVLINTKIRLKYLHYYGKEVFQETTIDPLKTIGRDLLPRFLVSSYYINMLQRLSSTINLPNASTLQLRLPKSSNVLNLMPENLNDQNLHVSLETLIHDRILYISFLEYLKTILASEYLLCARAIVVYQCLWKDNKPYLKKNERPSYVEDAAWVIYLYFIAIGAPYEVSVKDIRRKRIMQLLASPEEDMFNEQLKSVFKALHHHYNNYLGSVVFRALPSVIMREQKDLIPSKSICRKPKMMKYALIPSILRKGRILTPIPGKRSSKFTGLFSNPIAVGSVL